MSTELPPEVVPLQEELARLTGSLRLETDPHCRFYIQCERKSLARKIVALEMQYNGRDHDTTKKGALRHIRGADPEEIKSRGRGKGK